jgi:predicted adenine nucleotide alpha hydrolase (AANH) superfamily ATPase
MNNVINYYLKSQQIINNLDKKAAKTKLLLHACCGICMIYPLDYLTPYFDVTIYYSNSNIFPNEEFERRYATLCEYLEIFFQKTGIRVNSIKANYNHETFVQDLLPYKDLPEGEERCFICYTKRMDEAFKYADENGFDFFTTTLTVSRQKDSQVINHIAEKLQKNYFNCKYFYSDFKKNAGGEIGNKRAKDLGLYMQHFCGCEFSKKEE